MITTIILTVSRRDFLPEVISSLELLQCDQSYTNLLCVVDGDAKLYTEVRNFIQTTKFNERLTVQFTGKGTIKRYDEHARRRRIAQIHNFAKQQIGIADYVFLVEDDTIIPPNALTALRTALNGVVGAIMAEGVEIGRWGIPYIGAWSFNDIYEPTQVTSLEYKRTGIEEIDAGGFYCALIRADIYKDHEFETFESLGPDVSMGLKLRQKGYVNLINWDVPCKHLHLGYKNEKEILIPSKNTKVVTLERKNQNNWSVKY